MKDRKGKEKYLKVDELDMTKISMIDSRRDFRDSINSIIENEGDMLLEAISEVEDINIDDEIPEIVAWIKSLEDESDDDESKDLENAKLILDDAFGLNFKIKRGKKDEGGEEKEIGS